MDRPARVPSAETAELPAAALLKLMTFLSPAFPVGAFSYSHGLEWLIDCAAIRCAETLAEWLRDLIEVGGVWNDAVLFAEAHRATAAGAGASLLEVAAVGAALAPSKERHFETTAQGRAFLDAVDAAWPCAILHALRKEPAVPYPVAVGAVAAAHGIGLESALPAFLNAFAANLVSVGVRLIPIGQSAGLKVLADLHPAIAQAGARAGDATLDDLGSAAILADIASMRHETQYSRVFRT